MTEVPIGRFGPVTGRRRDVTVRLTDLSFRQTIKGNQFPYPDFGSDFIEALHGALATPRRRGILRSTISCPWCETSLDRIAVGRVQVSTEVTLKRIPPIRVDLLMPGFTCPGCGRSVASGNRDVESDLSDALIDAFKAVALSPG